MPRGALLLTIDQVDTTADGVPVLVSREHHLADAFSFTVLRDGPGPHHRGGALSGDGPLVVGDRRRFAGTCAQALEPDGTLVATSYAPHSLSYPRPGWAEQDPGEWTRALVQTLAEVRLAAAGRPIAALSFGSQLDGLVATDRDGHALRPALIWSDRRAVAECERVAGRTDVEPLAAADRLQHRPRSRGGEDRLAACARARRRPRVASYLLPGSWVAWQAAGECAVDPSNASSTGLFDPRRMDWCEEACAAFEVDPDRLAPVRPADTVLGPVAPWLRDAAGLTADTEVVLGAGDEMAAVLGAGVVEPGEVCDVMGTAEPVCAVVAQPVLNVSEVVELHPHAVPGRWLLENPGWLSGGAYRWFRDELGGPEVARAAATGADVYELLNTLARGAPPGADGVCWVPALSGAMAPEWNAKARAGWFGLTAAHGRAHMARALLEGNALALRDVVEAIAASRSPPDWSGLRGRRRARRPAAGDPRAHNGAHGVSPARRGDDGEGRGHARRRGHWASRHGGPRRPGDGRSARRSRGARS